ncbi:MAG: DNA alkylation repair protein [Candidatus Nanoarchaeia archaeon]
METEEIREELIKLGDKRRADFAKRYLKSPYEFYGLRVPDIRKLTEEDKDDFYSALNTFDELWKSGNHEEMSFALYLIRKFAKTNQPELWKFLIERIERIKTWDHADEISAHILGVIVRDNLQLIKEIKEMSESKNPWMRRISIVSTYPLIKENKNELTLRLAERLVYDNNIYVQKGAGWMLREMGKKNRLALRDFLMMHLDMKPIAFSYATEKMTELRNIKKETAKKQREKLKEEAKTKKKRK